MDIEELKQRLRSDTYLSTDTREAADALSQLQAENAELRRELEEVRKIRDAAENLVRVKGRHHAEIAYKRLADTVTARQQQGDSAKG